MSAIAERPLDAELAAEPEASPNLRPASRGRLGLSSARMLEAVAVAVLVASLAIQRLSYPVMYDPNPDGYGYYAEHLLKNGTLMPSFSRGPGFPAFLALVAWATGSPIEVRDTTGVNHPFIESVYWAQAALCILLIVGVWAVVRAKVSPLAGLVFLGMMAAANYFVRVSAWMMPDFLFAVVWTILAYPTGLWVLRWRTWRSWLWLVPLAAGFFALHAIRPNGAPLVGSYAVALAGALASERFLDRHRWRSPAWRDQGWARAAALGIVSVLVLFAADTWLSSGPREYGAQIFQYRVVVHVPPASDAPEELRIEAGRESFRAVEGELPESSRLFGFRKRSSSDFVTHDMRAEDVTKVWRARLLAHPGHYVLSILRDIQLNHYRVIHYFVPFLPELGTTATLNLFYLPDDGSLPSELFRKTGIMDMRGGIDGSNWRLGTVLTIAIATLVAFWGLVALGVRELMDHNRALTLAMCGLAVMHVVLLAAMNTIDGRYLLPFTAPCYVAQAAGLTRLARPLLHR